jgi:hypothetical protein
MNTPAYPLELVFEDASHDRIALLLVFVMNVGLAAYGWRFIGRDLNDKPSHRRSAQVISAASLLLCLSAFFVSPPDVMGSARFDASGVWTVRSPSGEVLYEGPPQPGCALDVRPLSRRLDLMRRDLVRAELRAAAQGGAWSTPALWAQDDALAQLRAVVDARCATPDAAPPEPTAPRPP